MGHGICDIPTDTCTCTGGYHGVICQFAPNQDECVNPTDCNQDLCQGYTCTTGTPRLCVAGSPVVCPTSNLCITYAGCNSSSGLCIVLNNKTATCNDGNSCTDDSCNPANGNCVFVNRSCTYLDTSCYTGYCDPRAPPDAQCFTQNIICPNPGNCVAICKQNSTFCGCEYTNCPIGVTNPPTPPPTPCKTASPTNAPTAKPTAPQPTVPGQTFAPTVESGPTSPTSESGGGLPLGAIIGIAVGGGVGVILIIIVIALIIWKINSGGSERV